MVRRLPDGQINWLTVFRAKPGQTSGTTDKQEGAAAEPWNVILKEAAIARGDLQLEDLAVDPNVKLRMSAITGTVGNVVSDGSQRAARAANALRQRRHARRQRWRALESLGFRSARRRAQPRYRRRASVHRRAPECSAGERPAFGARQCRGQPGVGRSAAEGGVQGQWPAREPAHARRAARTTCSSGRCSTSSRSTRKSAIRRRR